MDVDRGTWPPMVRIALFGVPNRTAAWICIWLSIALAVGSVAYGFINPIGFLGVAFVLAALWYFLALRWVDQNSKWS